jgi:hypothetical protein
MIRCVLVLRPKNNGKTGNWILPAGFWTYDDEFDEMCAGPFRD